MFCNNTLVDCTYCYESVFKDISKKISYGVWNIVNRLLKVSYSLYINILYGYV